MHVIFVDASVVKSRAGVIDWRRALQIRNEPRAECRFLPEAALHWTARLRGCRFAPEPIFGVRMGFAFDDYVGYLG